MRDRSISALIQRDQTHAPGRCWIWLGHLDVHGSGKIMRGNVVTSAARAVWSEVHGELPPDDKVLLRNCGQRGCVNPDHHAPTRRDEVVREIVRQHRTIELADLRGAMNPHATLRDEDVLFIRAQKKVRGLCGVLARLFRVRPDTISAIRNRKRWTHLGKGNKANAMPLEQLRGLADVREWERFDLDHEAQARSEAA